MVSQVLIERVCAGGIPAGAAGRGDWTILLAARGIRMVRHDADFFPRKIDRAKAENPPGH